MTATRFLIAGSGIRTGAYPNPVTFKVVRF
jgi:hypothetical protein